MAVSPKVVQPSEKKTATDKVSFFSAWCKRCGNCVSFCPRKALDKDQWGYPVLADPDRCTTCGLCEMLCPDFAISVGEAPSQPGAAMAKGSRVAPTTSPERLAPEPPAKENGNG